MTAASTIVLGVHTERQHGVADYARALAERLVETGADVELRDVVEAEDPASDDADRLRRLQRRHLHVHFTDRLWGSTSTEAADRIEALAARWTVTVTLHDLPQPSDGHAFAARTTAYGRVVRAASGVVVNSEHELSLADEHLGAVTTPLTVIPLPVDIAAPGGTPEGWVPEPAAAVLGFVYPGKGHAEVIDAVAASARALDVVALGRASDGHEADLAALEQRAREAGHSFSATGFLPQPELVRRCRLVAVPVIAHQHYSASGSLATWIAAGRRPLVVDSRYAREMDALRPGTLRLVAADGLPAAIGAALDDPASTWLGADAVTRPDSDDAVAAYAAWWREVGG